MENQIIFYQDETGNVTVPVTYQNDSFWLTQKTIAQLFGVEVSAISKHFSNIYEEKELKKEVTISKMETVQIEGNREVKQLYLKPMLTEQINL